MSAQHIICTVRARTEHREKVKSLLLDLVGPAIAEEGCLYYYIYQQNDEPDTFHIVDGWVSAEAGEAHVGHPNATRWLQSLHHSYLSLWNFERARGSADEQERQHRTGFSHRIVGWPRLAGGQTTLRRRS